jgi:hypothetical protein
VRFLAFLVGLVAFAAAAPPGWHTFRADGVSVRDPPGWDATTAALTGVTSPSQTLAVASYPLPATASGSDG